MDPSLSEPGASGGGGSDLTVAFSLNFSEGSTVVSYSWRVGKILMFQRTQEKIKTPFLENQL